MCPIDPTTRKATRGKRTDVTQHPYDSDPFSTAYEEKDEERQDLAKRETEKK
jgi:hypothetical protein